MNRELELVGNQLREGLSSTTIEQRMTKNQKYISEDNSSDIKKIAKGAGITIIGNAIGGGLWFLSQVIIVRFIGAEFFGLYILGLVVVKMTDIIARFGLHNAAMRFVSIYRKNNPERVKGIQISATSISFLNGILLGSLVYAFAGFISGSVFHKPDLINIIRVFAICVPFIATMRVVSSISRGFHTAKYHVYILNIIQPLGNLSLILLFILMDFGVYGVVSAFVISHIIALFAGFYFLTKQFKTVADEKVKAAFEIKKLLFYSAPLMFSGFLVYFIRWTDSIMLGIMKTSMDVSIYRAAAQIPLFLTLVLTAGNSIFAPTVAEIHSLRENIRQERIFKAITRWIFFITLPASLILIFSSKALISIFGPDFIETGSVVLIVLTIAQFFNCITGGVGVTLNMTGKQNVEMINSVAMVVINIMLNYFFIPKYGSLGAAIATGISIGSINLLRLLEVYVIYRIHPYSVNYLNGIVSGIITFVLLFLLKNYLESFSIYVAFISNTIIVCLVFITVFCIGGINDEDRLVFNAISKKINGRLFSFNFAFLKK